MTRVNITAHGGTEFEAKLHKTSERLGDSIKIAALLMEGLEKYHEATWGRGVESTPETDIRWPEHGPLYNTGRLKNSMTKAEAPGAVREITPLGLKFGTKLHYAQFLQHGTSKMRRKPVLRKKREMAAVMGAILHRWVLHGR